jgi:hypothetical protein
MIVDSTGLSFGRASEWYEQKYGRKATQTPWRKMHLSIDADMNVHAIRYRHGSIGQRSNGRCVARRCAAGAGDCRRRELTASSAPKRCQARA